MGAKMAVSLRGFDICIYPLKHPGCYLNLWTKVDKVHSISDDNTKRAFENGMKPEQLVSKICPAIDPGKFGMSEWKMNKEHPKILTVARLHWKKGLEDSLIALSILRNLGIQFQYNIVGAGDEFERLKYISYKLGLTDSVHFLGKKSHEEVRDLMSSHQIYLQYSLSEGFCNAVLEAQASGLLCIVSDAEGLPENVMNGETGWVIPRSNPPLLAGKLQELISLEQSDVQRVRQAASKRVAEQFNLTKQEGEFHKFYVQ
jgi:colanic acid/amylovoran biosynthesis glycosyltransferase